MPSNSLDYNSCPKGSISAWFDWKAHFCRPMVNQQSAHGRPCSIILTQYSMGRPWGRPDPPRPWFTRAWLLHLKWIFHCSAFAAQTHLRYLPAIARSGCWSLAVSTSSNPDMKMNVSTTKSKCAPIKNHSTALDCNSTGKSAVAVILSSAIP